MIEYKPFTGLLNFWCSKEVYDQEKRELDKQINLLFELQGGLGQSSQGHPEDWKQNYDMLREVQKLGISIKTAMGIL